MLTKFEMVEIEDISKEDFIGEVYDLSVEEDHSYNIEGIIVHNSGAACSTRRVVGYGVPQFAATLDCAEAFYKHNLSGKVKIISDGGIRHSGDVLKSLWSGADSVMCGYLFAGHDECPNIDGEKYYRGMSSRNVSGRTDIAAEGVCMKMKNKGPVENTVTEWAAAVRAGFSMGNARNIKELRENVYAIRVSTMSNAESDPVSE